VDERDRVLRRGTRRRYMRDDEYDENDEYGENDEDDLERLF